MTGNLSQAHQIGVDGAVSGLAIGAVSGATSGYASAKARGLNPFNGKNIYPRNDGFKGKSTETTLQPGQIIDRYGPETGKFFAPEGTPFSNRSLHPNTNIELFNSYEVLRPFSVLSGTTAPFYGQPGGGTQYFSPSMNVQQLILQGYIRPTTR
ncbi:MAG: TNT domain-containing protein, partial [Culturomica sp.]|jgi:hypothetical protein|nr:TNT domain-containing protein [Culturomica sp.]